MAGVILERTSGFKPLSETRAISSAKVFKTYLHRTKFVFLLILAELFPFINIFIGSRFNHII